MDISPLKLRNSENGKNVENKEEYSDEDSDKEVRYQQMDCIMTEGTYGHTWRHEYEI